MKKATPDNNSLFRYFLPQKRNGVRKPISLIRFLIKPGH